MLQIVATPIGNLEDITLRALRTLRDADFVVAEDTRHTGLLLKHHHLPHKPMIALYDEVEIQRINQILLLAQDKTIVLVSDAGTPLISDPGYKLVRAALTAGIKLEFIPGPTAAIAALVLSGLPPDKFLFLGYPPEKESHQRLLVAKIKQLPIDTTTIFYVSPYKLLKFLRLLADLLGDVETVLCRELTKVHEEVWRGKISQAIIDFPHAKGEFVLLLNLKQQP